MPKLKFDAILGKLRGIDNAIEINYNDSEMVGVENINDALDYVIQQLKAIPDPLLFKGSINDAEQFPTLAQVKPGWMYTISADVTDDDATKTNTGQEFLEYDEIAWNGTDWTVLGSLQTGTGFTDIIYVDNGRTDTYIPDGRNVYPYKDLGSAVAVAPAGSVIMMNAGDYTATMIDKDLTLIGYTNNTSAATVINGRLTIVGSSTKVYLQGVTLRNISDDVLYAAECEKLQATSCVIERLSSLSDRAVYVGQAECILRDCTISGVAYTAGVTSVLHIRKCDSLECSLDAVAGTIQVCNSALSHVNVTDANVTLSGCSKIGNWTQNGTGVSILSNIYSLDDITVIAGVFNADVKYIQGVVTHSGGVCVIYNTQNFNGDDGSGNVINSTATAAGFGVLALVNCNIQDFNSALKKINKTGDGFYVLQSRRDFVNDVINGTRLFYISADFDIQNTSATAGASVKDALDKITVAPTTHNNNYVPQWDGQDTKTLKEGFQFIEQYASVPANQSSAGVKGQRAYASNYVYECVETNTWVRYAAESTFTS